VNIKDPMDMPRSFDIDGPGDNEQQINFLNEYASLSDMDHLTHNGKKPGPIRATKFIPPAKETLPVTSSPVEPRASTAPSKSIPQAGAAKFDVDLLKGFNPNMVFFSFTILISRLTFLVAAPTQAGDRF
jgi:hypothetical protein